jgi:hypothetical protein
VAVPCERCHETFAIAREEPQSESRRMIDVPRRPTHVNQAYARDAEGRGERDVAHHRLGAALPRPSVSKLRLQKGPRAHAVERLVDDLDRPRAPGTPPPTRRSSGASSCPPGASSRTCAVRQQLAGENRRLTIRQAERTRRTNSLRGKWAAKSLSLRVASPDPVAGAGPPGGPT